MSTLASTPVDPQVSAAVQNYLADPNAWRLTPATLAVHITNGHWIPAKHLLYISARIASALARGNGRLIVSMPPRHGKSELLSVNTPIWTLDRNPRNDIILASYGQELASDFGRKCRDQILDVEDELSCKLRRDALGATRFLTTAGGGMRTAGVGGTITGRGADVLFIDDYIKNDEEAASATQRDKIYDWFIATALTRLEPGGSIIIIATRWNIDDLIGRLLTLQPDVWDHIRLPALAEADDPLGREVGEALWPERYDVDALNAIKKAQGPYFWQALFQQAPIPISGIFQAHWLTPIDVPPHHTHLRCIRYWDFASTSNAGDYTVGFKVAEDLQTGLTHILDRVRGQWGPAEVEQIVRATAEADGHSVIIGIEQEPGSAGKSVISHYDRNVLKGYTVRGDRPTGQKIVRAQGFLAAAANGSVRMLRANWNAELLDEFKVFPDGPHDDQVDSICGAYKLLYENFYGSTTWGRTLASDIAEQETTGFGKVISGVTFGRK